jgi:NTE family protein
VSPLFVLKDSTLLEGLNKLDIRLQDFTNQLYLQTIFRKDFALRMGGEYKRLRIDSETIIENDQDDDIVFENTGYFSLFSNVIFDSYSDPYFPKSGVYFNGDIHWYLGASQFNRDFDSFSILKGDIGYAFSVSNKLAFKLETSGGFKIGDDSTTTLDFGLGGYAHNFINNFQSFYGYDFLALTGNSFIKTSITADYEIFRKNHILLSANYANIEDDLFENIDWFRTPDFSGYAIGYSIETFLGPIEAKYSFSPETNDSIWYFNLGYWF